MHIMHIIFLIKFLKLKIYEEYEGEIIFIINTYLVALVVKNTYIFNIDSSFNKKSKMNKIIKIIDF